MKTVLGVDIKKYLQKKQNVDFRGDFAIPVKGFCSLNQPKSDCITWIKNPTNQSLEAFKNCKNNIVVSSEEIQNSIDGVCFILTDTPKMVFFDILNHFWKLKKEKTIAEDSVIETKNIGKNVSIGHHCYIGPDVIIGDNTIIEHNVSIVCPAKIGCNCLIHSGVVIGTDGFGFFMEDGILSKVDHFGGVRIGDDVEIGANSCIDRATIDDTVIGNHTKIDNLCNIAHNVVIEDNVTMVALAMISGSVRLGKDSYIGPNAIVKNQVTVEENAFVGMGAVVIKNVEKDTVVAGVPARMMRMVKPEDK